MIVFPPLMAIIAGTAAWFVLLGFLHMLSWIGLVQVAYIRGKWMGLLVVSLDLAFIGWVCDVNLAAIIIAASFPWIGYVYYLNARRVLRGRRARRVAGQR